MQLLSVKNLFREDVGATETFEIEETGKDLEFPESISVGKITGKVTAFKLEDSIVVSGKFVAEAGLICDRCLDNFEKPVKFSFEREYQLDRKAQSDEGLYVDKYGSVDISEPVREELILAVPTQNFCKSECPGICLGCGRNLNHEACTCKISE